MTRAHHGLVPGVTVEPLSGWPDRVARIRIRGMGTAPGGDELSCAWQELPVLSRWLRAMHGRPPRGVPLPVPEYSRPGWGPEYRWTAAGEAVTRAHPLPRRVRR